MKYLLLFILVVSTMAGCTRTPNNGASPSQDDNVRNDQVKVQQTVPEKPKILNPQEVSDHLEKLASGVPLVQGAHCVIFGNTAVVGIDVPPELERARIGTIKYSVAEALRKDTYGVHAIVTADMDLSQRLKKIRDSIVEGRPIAGFADEMANIVGRIVPQLPQDIKPQQNQPEQSQESKKLHKNHL